MGRRGRGLAGRFRQAFQSEAEKEARAAEEARRREQRAAAERSRLFDDLIAFAEETGFLRSTLREGALRLVHGERALRFEAVGDGGAVEVAWEQQDPEETHRLYVEERLEGAWVWARKRRMRQREDRELFWDKGLEELLVLGLGLPRPDGAAPVADDEPEDDGAGGRGRSL